MRRRCSYLDACSLSNKWRYDTNQYHHDFDPLFFFRSSLSLFTLSPEEIACFALFGSMRTCSPAFLPESDFPLYSDDLTLPPLLFGSDILMGALSRCFWLGEGACSVPRRLTRSLRQQVPFPEGLRQGFNTCKDDMAMSQRRFEIRMVCDTRRNILPSAS
jgi:hypothetical protein